MTPHIGECYDFSSKNDPVHSQSTQKRFGRVRVVGPRTRDERLHDTKQEETGTFGNGYVTWGRGEEGKL